MPCRRQRNSRFAAPSEVVTVRALFLIHASILVVSSISNASAEDLKIRTMAANLSSGSKQSYDPGEGMRIFQGLRPDVVMIQEFNFKKNTNEDIRAMVDEAFGPQFHYYRESEPTDTISNGVISRFPILESGEWEDTEMPNRDFAYAKIDLPGEQELWAISVHLSASKHPKRLAQAEELKRLINEKIPAQDYVVLGGDFNIQKRDDAVISILKPVVFETAAPVSSAGKTETNMSGKKNYDWILNDADLAQHQTPIDFVAGQSAMTEGRDRYSFGLVFDSTVFPNLDWVKPIFSSDSRAPGMQHLAVIKDYLVPMPKVENDCR